MGKSGVFKFRLPSFLGKAVFFCPKDPPVLKFNKKSFSTETQFATAVSMIFPLVKWPERFCWFFFFAKTRCAPKSSSPPKQPMLFQHPGQAALSIANSISRVPQDSQSNCSPPPPQQQQQLQHSQSFPQGLPDSRSSPKTAIPSSIPLREILRLPCFSIQFCSFGENIPCTHARGTLHCPAVLLRQALHRCLVN